MFEEARALLARAKDEYQRALNAVDVHLLAGVRADLKNAKAAQAIQNSYTTGFEAKPLTLLLQPKAAAPKAKRAYRRRAGRPAAKKGTRKA